MSGIKRHIEDIEARYRFGLELCMETGALEECENHPGSYYEGDEGEDGLEAAYKLANSRITSGKLQMERREATDAIKDAYEDNSGIDYCPSCDHNMRD